MWLKKIVHHIIITWLRTRFCQSRLEPIVMATEALHAHVQSEVANALTVLHTELQQSLQEVATVTNAHEERLSALETSERTSSRRDNVTAKRETESLPVFGEKHGPVDADWCFDVYTAVEQVCEEVNLITQWVVGRGH